MDIPVVNVVPVPFTPGFAQNAYTYSQQMAAFSQAMPAFRDWLGSLGLGAFNATSATNVVVGLGVKNFVVEAGKAFIKGQFLIAADDADPGTNFMVGSVNSYDVVTGALQLNVLKKNGAGAISDWIISVTAVDGLTHPVGTIYTGLTEPTDGTWLPPDGSPYLQASYPALYAALGLLADRPMAGLAWVNNAAVVLAMNSMAWTGTEWIGSSGAAIKRLGADASGYTDAVATGPAFANVAVVASNGVSGAGNQCWAVCTAGATTYKSTDGGANWPAGGAITAGAYNNNQYGGGRFVAVGNNLCSTTDDGGTTVVARVFAGNVAPQTLEFLGAGKWAIADTTGGVRISTDNGATFAAAVPTGLTAVSSLKLVDGKLIAAGHLNGLPAMSVSPDLGGSWRLKWNGAVGSATAFTGIAHLGGLTLAVTNAAGNLAWSLNSQDLALASTSAAVGGTNARIYAHPGAGRMVATNGLTTNGVQRMSNLVLSYSTATQFAVPTVRSPQGMRSWIKAAL